MSRIVVVGAGLVGATAAYAMLQRGLARELVLTDIDQARAEGEAMDLSHATPFFKSAKVKVASLASVDSADVVVIAAGRASRPGETRLDLLKDNAGRIRGICAVLKQWKRVPVVVVISNPVDVLTEIASRELGGSNGHVLGTGTSLDTARLKAMLGERFALDTHSIHGYILGEHGDSEFPAWSTVTAGGLNVERWPGHDPKEMEALFQRVRTAAYEIVKRKRATYYAVGAACAMITEAVLRDQNSIYPVSVPLRGQYGLTGVSLSLPCVVGRQGIVRVLEPELSAQERRSLQASADVLKAALATV